MLLDFSNILLIHLPVWVFDVIGYSGFFSSSYASSIPRPPMIPSAAAAADSCWPALQPKHEVRREKLLTPHNAQSQSFVASFLPAALPSPQP